MKQFKWISNQKQWDEAIAALLLCDLPMALLDDGGDIRHTVIRDDDTCIAVIAEQSREDGRGDIVWGEIRKVYFSAGTEGGVARFGGSTISERALLSLALHAASANCTDDDGKPKPFLHDGELGTPHTIDDPKQPDGIDLSRSLDGHGWVWYPDVYLLELVDGAGEVLAQVVRREPAEWQALVPGKLPGIEFSSYREAMTDAEATIIGDMARDAESIRLTKATGMDAVLHEWSGRCPIHECHNGDRECGRESYDREACAETVKNVVLAREQPTMREMNSDEHSGMHFLGSSRSTVSPLQIEVVDATPAKNHAERLLRCGAMLLQISEATIVDVYDHLCAIVEVEAGEATESAMVESASHRNESPAV